MQFGHFNLHATNLDDPARTIRDGNGRHTFDAVIARPMIGEFMGFGLTRPGNAVVSGH